jgi:flavin-binding protein dodecin
VLQIPVLMQINALPAGQSSNAVGQAKEGSAMATLKVIEVLSQSDESWEDAAQSAVDDAAKSVRGIKSVYVKELEAVVENDKITQYRINAKISFMVEGTQ